MNDFEQLAGLNGVWTRKSKVFQDRRGHFSEVFRHESLRELGVIFAQTSVSHSKSNVARGMHLQEGQWQLVTVLDGEITDFLIDARQPNRFIERAVNLKSSERNQILLSPGFFHGFHVQSNQATILYMSNVLYGSSPEHGISMESLSSCKGLTSEWIMSDRDRRFKMVDCVEQ